MFRRSLNDNDWNWRTNNHLQCPTAGKFLHPFNTMSSHDHKIGVNFLCNFSNCSKNTANPDDHSWFMIVLFEGSFSQLFAFFSGTFNLIFLLNDMYQSNIVFHYFCYDQGMLQSIFANLSKIVRNNNGMFLFFHNFLLIIVFDLSIIILFLTKLPIVKGITSYEFYKKNEAIFNIFFLDIPSDFIKYSFFIAIEGPAAITGNQTNCSWQGLVAF